MQDGKIKKRAAAAIRRMIMAATELAEIEKQSKIPSLNVRGRLRFNPQAVQDAINQTPKHTPEFLLSDYTFPAQLSTTLGLIDFKTGVVSTADLEEAQKLHITTATELKHHIKKAVGGLSDAEISKIINRLGYLFGIYQGRLSWGKND